MIKKTILLITVVLLVSCVDYQTYTEFVIKNSLEHEVKIHVPNFRTTVDLPADTIFVIASGSMIKYFYLKDGENSVYEHPFGLYSDSLEIFYNDTVSRMFYRNDESKYNLLKIENYLGEKIKKRSFEYTYEITERDFLDALTN